MSISELLHQLELFKCLYQSCCPCWSYLNVYIRVAALAGAVLMFISESLPWLELFKCLILMILNDVTDTQSQSYSKDLF